MRLQIIETVADLSDRLSDLRAQGANIGFVPTMGSLHAGHVSLVEASVAENDTTVLSIFVNPLQFSPDEDFDNYPRNIQADIACSKRHGVDIVFNPPPSEVFPAGAEIDVKAGEFARLFEGIYRPTHFDGVATVVARLFRILGDCSAYFGEKDFQQLVVVQKMVSNLSLPVAVVGCPTVRELDGLALSSRNVYLDRDERSQASFLYKSLRTGASLVEEGERELRTVIAKMGAVLAQAPLADVEYLAVVDPETFLELNHVEAGSKIRLLAAARFGRARLIDNVGVVTR